MGKLPLLALLVVVCFAFASSIIPPAPIRGLKKGLVSAKAPIQVSVTSRQCSVMRRFTHFEKVTMPFLCHSATQRVLPLPRNMGPVTSAQIMMTLKAGGWSLCYKPMPVPLYKFQRIPVCCPGTIPTPNGGCMVRKPVRKVSRKMTPAQFLSKTKTKSYPSQLQRPNKTKLGTPRSFPPPSLPFPVLWKAPKPYRGMLPNAAKGMRVGLPPPVLLRMLSKGQGSSAFTTPKRRLKAPPSKSKSLIKPPTATNPFFLPLLTKLMFNNRPTKTMPKSKPTKVQSARPSSSSLRSKLSPAATLLKSRRTKPVVKPSSAKAVPRRQPAAPVFGFSPKGPLFKLVMSNLLARSKPSRPLPPKPASSATSRPASSVPASRSVAAMSKSLLNDLLFGSRTPGPLSRPRSLQSLPKFVSRGPLSNVRPPMMPKGPRYNIRPSTMNRPGPLSNIRPPVMPSLLSSIRPSLMPKGPLSNIRPPFASPGPLSNIRPPMFPSLLPKGPMSNVLPPMTPSGLLSSILPTMVMSDFLSSVRSTMMPQRFMSSVRSPVMARGPLPPKMSRISSSNARSSMLSGKGPLSNVRPAMSGRQSPIKKSSSDLSDWHKEVARYLASMMYHKLQVEQQHKSLLAEVSRQNSLRQQLEMLLTQEIIQTHQRRQQQKQQQQQQQQIQLQQQLQQQQQQQLQQQQLQQQQQQQQPPQPPQWLETHSQPQQEISFEETPLTERQNGTQLPLINFQENPLPQRDNGKTQEFINFQESPFTKPNPIPAPPLQNFAPTTTLTDQQGGPTTAMSETMQTDQQQQQQQHQQQQQPTPSQMDVDVDVDMEDVEQTVLPLAQGILENLPHMSPSPAPVFAAGNLPQGVQNLQNEMEEVKQKVKSIVNDCLARSNITTTMEQVLQLGDPRALRPICRKSDTVGPCVLAMTQDVLGQDTGSMIGRQLVQSVLMALGQTCARLEGKWLLYADDWDIVEKLSRVAEQQAFDPNDSDVMTSTAMFPNPPPVIAEEVVTDVTSPDTEESSTMTQNDNAIDEALARRPTEPAKKTATSAPGTTVPPSVEQEQKISKPTHQVPQEQSNEASTKEEEADIPLWMILVMVGGCAGLLLIVCTCACVMLRCRRRNAKTHVIDHEPEKLPVPEEVRVYGSTPVVPPPAYQKTQDVLREDGFKIPEDVGKSGSDSR